MFNIRKNVSDNYELKLRELNHIHHLALEQYKDSYPKFKVNPENKRNSSEFNKDKANLRKVEAKLFLLESSLKNNIKEKEEIIKKTDKKIKNQKLLNKALTTLDDDQTDKDEALIEMANELKELQSERLMYLFDTVLGISLLAYFIFKKTRTS